MFTKNLNSKLKKSEMELRIRAQDWKETPVGALENWSVSLRSSLALMLNSRLPMFLFWGKELTCFYNDACQEGLSITGRHTKILGKPGCIALSEIWFIILPVIEELIATGDASWHEDQWLPVLRNGKLENTYWTSSYSPVNDESGKLEGIVIMMNDVTKKVEAGKKMEDAEQRARLATEIAQIATWDLDLQAHTMIHSESLAAIFGHQKSVQLSYSDLMDQLHPEDLVNIAEKAFGVAMQTGIYKYEARFIKKDGTLGWIRSHGQLFYDDNDEPLKIIGTLINITEEKNFTELLESQVSERTAELQQNNVRLVKINIELQSFAYISSHDLQEPLRKIQTFISRLRNDEVHGFTPAATYYLNRIHKASERMRSLIQDLLDYSRTNVTDKAFAVKNLAVLAEEVKEDYSEVIRELNATIEISGLLLAKVIPFQFKQLFSNLIGNALKFTKPDVKPCITISFNPIDGLEIKDLGADIRLTYCHIRIKDNGIGFNIKFKDRIFEVFQRLHNDADYVGTGIGLAIVKKIVENHKGFITADGYENQGATFDIFIPETKGISLKV